MSSRGTDWFVPEDVPEHWGASHVLCTLCMEVLLNGPLKAEVVEELLCVLGAGEIWERAQVLAKETCAEQDEGPESDVDLSVAEEQALIDADDSWNEDDQ